MRHLISFIFLSCTLTLQAQQAKKTNATPTQKAVPAKQTPKTAATAKQTPAKQTPAKPAAAKQTPKTTTATAKQTTAKQAPPKQTPAKQTPANPTPATNDIKKLKKEQEGLQRQIKESQAMIKTTQENVSSQLANLAVITGSINSQKEYVAGIQDEIDTLSHNIGALGKDIMFLEDDLEECRRKYSHGLMYMYRTRLTQSKLMFIFSAKNFSQMYRRIRYAQEYTKYQRAQAIIIEKKKEAIRNKRDQLQTASSRKTSLLKEGKRQQRELEQQQHDRQAVVDELNKKQAQLQATLAEQRRQSQQLNGRIDQLVQQEIRRAEEQRKAEEARRKAEEARRKAEAERQKAETERQRRAQATVSQSTPSKPTTNSPTPTSTTKKSKKKASAEPTPTPATPKDTPKYKAPDNADRKLSSNFAANQGHLPVPITGSYVISAHYGPYTPEGLEGVVLENKGTNFTSKTSAQARSIFDGEVTSVFSLGGMTNIIVRHGSYISVYCNLASANVRVGQNVSTRQILGPVARDASGNYTLHFQLRRETTKLNPESWIGR